MVFGVFVIFLLSFYKTPYTVNYFCQYFGVIDKIFTRRITDWHNIPIVNRFSSSKPFKLIDRVDVILYIYI